MIHLTAMKMIFQVQLYTQIPIKIAGITKTQTKKSILNRMLLVTIVVYNLYQRWILIALGMAMLCHRRYEFAGDIFR